MLRIALWLCVLFLVGCGPTPRQLGFSDAQWTEFSDAKRERITAGYDEVKKQGVTVALKHDGPDLSVYLADGTAMMPPFVKPQRFETLMFQIQAGRCLSVLLRSIDTHQSVRLAACYDGMTFSLDPSPYRVDQRTGSVHFVYTPVWKRGFTYNSVNTTGYVKLNRAMVTLKTIPGTTAPVQEAGNSDHG